MFHHTHTQNKKTVQSLLLQVITSSETAEAIPMRDHNIQCQENNNNVPTHQSSVPICYMFNLYSSHLGVILGGTQWV